MASFGDSAVKLAKSPLGLIAIFVLLVEAVAGLVVSNADSLTTLNQTIMVIFICLFPVLVVGMFWHLVINHNVKLYAPSEFPNHGDFLEANKVSTSAVLEKFKADILEDLDAAPDKVASSFTRGSVLIQSGRYISAADFLEKNKLSEKDIEELEVLAEEEDLEESRSSPVFKKLSKYSTVGVAGAVGVSEIAKAVLKLL